MTSSEVGVADRINERPLLWIGDRLVPVSSSIKHFSGKRLTFNEIQQVNPGGPFKQTKHQASTILSIEYSKK